MRNFLWGVLFPLSFVWAAVASFRRRNQKGYQSKLPICCVGNLHVGGSGKTPLVLAIGKYIRNKDKKVVLLSRGYRSELSSQGAQVIEDKQGSRKFGDEPWLLFKKLGVPTYIDRDRVRAVKKIEKTHPRGLVLMDDGFQHLALQKKINIVVINTHRDFHFPYCLPWGTLREPLKALSHCEAVVLVSSNEKNENGWRNLLSKVQGDFQIFSIRRKYTGLFDGTSSRPLGQENYGGFCGIADSIAFERQVVALGGHFIKAYKDHHAYRKEDVLYLRAQQEQLGLAGLVTTEKDWYKLSQLGVEMQGVVALQMEYEIPADFWYFVDQRLLDI